MRKRRKRILLIAPENSFGVGFARIPNLGLGYAAAAALAEGFDFHWLDAAKTPFTNADVASLIRSQDYLAVGLNLFTASLGPAKELCAALRQIRDLPPLIAGGPHPTFEPESTFDTLPELRFSFSGECEEGFPKLLKLLQEEPEATSQSLRGIPNLIWKDPDGVVHRNSHSYVEDLDRIPILPWDRIRPDDYPLSPNGIFSRSARIVPLIATRGCPYTCTFCGAPRSMGRKIRTRSVNNLIDEISWLQNRFGINEIHFMDDNFTLDRKFLRNFCETVCSRNLKFHWACPNGVRLDSLTENTLRLMEHAGCYSFAVGIESGSQRVLDLMEKKLSLEEIEQKVHLIKRVTKIRVTGFFVVGIPGETEGEIKQTIAFSKRLPLDRANFFNYSPFPGSPIYDKLKAQGRLDNLDLSKLYIHNVEYASDEIGRERLKALQRQAYIRFYARPRILWGLAQEIRSVSQVKTISRRAKMLLTP